MDNEAQRIISRDNTKLKFARRVRDGREHEYIFVEGVRLVEEALHSNLEIMEAFISDDFSDLPRRKPIIDALILNNTATFEIPAGIARSLSDTENGQGIILLAKRPAFASLDELIPGKKTNLPLVLYLEQINNPSNLGAIIRASEAAGVAGIITSKHSADPFSPKALRASMGSTFRVPIRTSEDFENVLNWATLAGLITTAADINASASHTTTDWTKRRLLIFGSEAHGLDKHIREQIGELCVIQIADEVESLNLAVACGILLFEAGVKTRRVSGFDFCF